MLVPAELPSPIKSGAWLPVLIGKFTIYLVYAPAMQKSTFICNPPYGGISDQDYCGKCFKTIHLIGPMIGQKIAHGINGSLSVHFLSSGQKYCAALDHLKKHTTPTRT